MLTVFVITCGHRPSLPRCLEALHGVEPRIIRDVAPMSAAFSLMRTDAPAFVQVDDDMILRPDALDRLEADLAESPHSVAVIAHPLWDVHLGRPILGVKIYRTEAVQMEWRDLQGCEVDQNKRLVERGFTVEMRWRAEWSGGHDWRRDHPALLGLHDPMYTPEMAFERYYDLTLKQRRYGQARWVEGLPGFFVKRLDSFANSVDLASLEGCRAAQQADLATTDHEKNALTRPYRTLYLPVAERLGLPVDP